MELTEETEDIAPIIVPNIIIERPLETIVEETLENEEFDIKSPPQILDSENLSIVDRIKNSLSPCTIEESAPNKGEEFSKNPIKDDLNSLISSEFSRDLRQSAADLVSINHHRFGDLAKISQVKQDLLHKLQILVDEERGTLERDLSRKIEELETMKRRHKEEEDRIANEIDILSQKLENLTPLTAKYNLNNLNSCKRF